MDNYPPVSCFCSVYGKVHCLPELVESFLRQDYKGIKELVILNDFDQQELIFTHPEVIVINTKQRIKPLGAKFNKNIEYCSHNIVAVMEIDDIYLNHHLTYAVEHMKDGIYHCGNAWVWTGKDKPLHHSGNYFHATHVFTKDLFNEVGGYTETIDNTTIDVNIISKFKQKLGNYTQSQKFEDISYIYKWGCGGYHCSGWGTGVNNASDLATESVQHQINLGNEKTGKIIIENKWNQPYDVLVKEALAKEKQNVKGN